jgi:DNA repair exonuclease SbcCD ATPase subunit
MAEFNAGFKIYADSTQFEKGMASVVRNAQDAGKKVASAFDGKAIGRTLATALGINLQSIADKVARFWTGFSTDAEDALEAMVAATGKAADAQERALEKLRAKKQKEKEDALKDAEEELEYFQKLEDKFRNEREKEAAKEKSARKEAATDLAAFEAEQAFAKLSTQEKLNTLKREEKNLATIIKDVEEGAKKNGEQTSAAMENLLIAKQRHVEIQSQIKELTAQTAMAEKVVTNETEKQVEAKTQLNGIAGVRGRFGEASESELREQIRRNEASVRGIGTPAIGPMGNLGAANEIARLQTEIGNIKQELAFRSKLQGDVSRLGTEGARRVFGGDALSFDRLVQQFVSDSRSTQELAASTNELLRQMNERQRNGIAVINLNGK